MSIDTSVLTKFFDIDDIDVQFAKQTVEFFAGTRENEDTVECVFQYYRKHGYPHYTIREDEKHSHMQRLINYDYSTIYKNDQLIQTMHGLRLAWSYFPHAWEIKCGSHKHSPMDNFNNDAMFRSTIKKCLNYMKTYGSMQFNENRLMQSLKIYSGVQAVSNFRPTAAAAIYNRWGVGGTTWDMSAGWGGRMLGALASNTIHTYIATEPSSKTFDGLCKMRDDFAYLGKSIQLHKCGSEEFVPEANSLDLCFTSPPYFDTEKYADEDTQSYIKFPTKDRWGNEFLLKTFQNCYYGLKHDHHMLVNISNTPSHTDLEQLTIELAKLAGFSYIGTNDLILSSIMGAGLKTEPIFIFLKD